MEPELANNDFMKAEEPDDGVIRVKAKGNKEPRTYSVHNKQPTAHDFQSRVDELQALYETSLVISSLKDPREIGDALVNILTENMNWHHILIRIYDQATDSLRLLSFAQPGIRSDKEYAAIEKRFNELVSKPGQGVSGWVFQTGEVVRSGNINDDPHFISTYPGLHSGLYVPIKTGNNIVGVISIESEEADAFNEFDEKLLLTIATQTAVVIENAQLLDSVRNELEQRKQTEKALLESERKYRLLAENVSDIIWVFDLETSRFTYISPSIIYLRGYSAEEAMQHSMEMSVSPSSYRYIQKVLPIRRVEFERGIIKHYTDELELPRKNGSTVWTETTTSFHMNNETGHLEIYGVSHNITERKQAEAELQKSNALYRLLAENSSDGVTLISGSGTVIYTSPAYMHMLGYGQDEIIGIGPSEIMNRIHPDDREKIAAEIKRGREQRLPTSRYEFRAIKKNGESIWIEDVLLREFDEDGQATQIIINSRNITERKLADEALRRSEERYRSLVSGMLDGVYRSTHDGRFIDINPAMVRMFGYESREEMLELDIKKDLYFQPEERESLFLDTGQEKVDVFRMRRRDGSEIWVEDHGRYVHDENGNVLYHEGIIRDVTERKLTEIELANSHGQFQRLVSQLPIGIQIFDTNGLCVDVNDAHAHIFGVSREQLVGEYNIFKDRMADVTGTSRAAQRVLAGETVVVTNQYFDFSKADPRFASGTGMMLNVTMFPIFNSNGEIVNFVGMNEDITERKRAEQQIEEQLKRLNALHTIEVAIKSSFDLVSTLEILLEQVTGQLKVDAASVLLFNKNTLTLDYMASRGFRSSATRHTQLQPGEGYAGRIILDRKIIHISDLQHTTNKLTNALKAGGESFSAYVGVPLIAKGQIVGVLEIFQRKALNPTSDWFDFLELLCDEAAIAIDNAQLFESLQRSNFDLMLAYDATIEGWSRALDLRDKETEGHTQRVTNLTLKLAQQMEIPDAEIIHIRRGALLHDIGKMGIPDRILLKPDKLTEEEWGIMRQHTLHASNMLSPIAYLKPALDIPLYHHEKWDGSGYPYQLHGEQIPLAARIFAIVDVWDALTSERPYRKAWTKEQAIEYIKQQSGSHFDPRVVREFLNLIGRI